jgi:hypothetical protein
MKPAIRNSNDRRPAAVPGPLNPWRKWNSSKLRRAAHNAFSPLRAAFIAALVVLSPFMAQPAEAACITKTYTLPSISYLQLALSNGRVVHLRRSVYMHYPTVNIWDNRRYIGQYYIPVTYAGLSIILINRVVLETWMGSVRQVVKQVPVVKACNYWAASQVGG